MTVIPRGENGSAAPRTPLWPPLAARGCSKARWSRSAASLASEAAAGEKTLRRDQCQCHASTALLAQHIARPPLRGVHRPAIAAATMPFGGLCGMGACPLDCSTTAVRRAAAHDVLPLGGACQPAGARGPRSRSPGWQSADRHYSAVIASILYAVATDSEVREREERRRRGAPPQLPLHEPHKNRL